MGSNRPAWSTDTPALVLLVEPPPPTRRRRPASLVPFDVPGDPANKLSVAVGAALELSPHPATSATSPGDEVGVAGLLGRECESTRSVSRRCATLWGLRGASAPAMESPDMPSFGGPGGPSAGRGRSQERQRNFELSLEARTVELEVPSSFTRPPGSALPLHPLEIRAASL